MRIEIINGVRTRMLEDEIKTCDKILRKVEDGNCYFVYAAWISDDGQYGDFEVFKKTYKPKHFLDDSTEYDNIEHYPCSEEWGKIAWSFRKRKNVDKQIKKILSKGIAD